MVAPPGLASTVSHPGMLLVIVCVCREQKGAVVDAQAASGVTALWLAAGEGRLDIVQLLIAEVRQAGRETGRGVRRPVTRLSWKRA